MQLPKQTLFIIGFMCLCAGTAIAQMKNSDHFMSEAFASLQQKDSVKYKALFPDYPLFVEIMRKMSETELGKDPASLSELASYVSQFTREDYENGILENIMKKFNHTLQKGEDAGLRWENSIIDNYQLDSTGSIGGMAEMEGDIYFHSNENKYKIRCNSIIRYNNILYGLRFGNISKLVDELYTGIFEKPEL